jgi:hypothetical protein
MSDGNDSLGGILITSSDWKRIREIEAHARTTFDEAKVNVWALKKALSEDVSRLVNVGNGIKMAVIAGAIVGAINTLVVMSTPPTRQWRHSELGPSRGGWRRRS